MGKKLIPKKGCGSGGNQIGNLNPLRNGTRISLPRLVSGSLGIKAVDDEARVYKRGLEAVVICDKGLATVEQIVAVQNTKNWKLWDQFVKTHIDAFDQHAIALADAAAKSAAVSRWLLRQRDERKMTVDQIQSAADNIVKANRTRFDAIKLLDLRAPPPDPWAEHDSRIVSAKVVAIQSER